MIKILYIEDDPDDAVIVSRYLKESNDQFVLDVAGSGAEAREKLKNNSFDCVLLDQNLPDTNGLALLQNIKSQWPEMPVLMLTGQKDDRLSIGSSKLGADDFIVKDEINTSVLTNTIFNVIHLGPDIGVDTSMDEKYAASSEHSELRFFKDGASGIYQTLVDTMTEGMISLDLNQTILFANQQAGDMLKADTNSLLGLRAKSLFDDKRFKLFEEKFKDATKGKSSKYEAELKCGRGKKRSVIISQGPYYDRWHTLMGCLMVVTDISERKRAEKKVVQSEKRFRDIAENTTDLIWEMDASGRFTYVNRIVKNILDFEPKDLLGKSIDKFVVSSEKMNVRKFVSSEVHSRVPVKVAEGKCRHKSGRVIFLEMSSIPIYDSIGEIIGYRGINRDITERKINEENRLREREIDLNLERCISQISKNLYEIDNFENAMKISLEFIGKTFKAEHCYLYTLRDFEDHDLFQKKHFWMVHNCDKIFSDQKNLKLHQFPSWSVRLTKNKFVAINDSSQVSDLNKAEKEFLSRYKIGSMLAVPLFKHDAFYGFLGIDFIEKSHTWRMPEIAAIRTITENISKVIERKHARAALLQQKTKFESVIKSTSEGVVLLDSDLKIILINPAARKMLRSFFRRIRMRTKLKRLGNVSISEIWNTIEENKLNSVSKEVKATNGSARFFTVVFSTVKNTKGNITGLVMNIHEISEIRRAQEQLLQSSKLASLGQLAAGVAHELNNPLTYMLGYTELLLSNDNTPDVSNKLAKILDGGHRMKNIIENMLEFSHNQTLQRELTDINKTIENTLSLMGRRLFTHSIKLIKTFDSKLPLVYCNKGELQQVFLNLIQNAFDEMVSSKSGDKIEIVTEQFSREKIRLKFIDNGPGMSEEVRERIFDPFYTTKAPGQGTGLGLSISYKIIQKHDGTITVKSELGKGSVFTIELPIKLDEAVTKSEMTDFDMEYREEKSCSVRGKIVILEDAKKSDSLVKILYRTKNQLITCNNISQALELCSSNEADLLLVDIKRLKEIKQRIRSGSIPNWKKQLIFLFDYPINEAIKNSLFSKGIGCMSFPFKIDEVFHLVNRTWQK